MLASLLTDHADRVFVGGLCSGLRDGFKIGYNGSRQPYASKNFKTAYLMPEIVDANFRISSDISRLRQHGCPFAS